MSRSSHESLSTDPPHNKICEVQVCNGEKKSSEQKMVVEVPKVNPAHTKLAVGPYSSSSSGICVGEPRDSLYPGEWAKLVLVGSGCPILLSL